MSPVGAKSLEVLENLDAKLDGSKPAGEGSPEARREPPSSGMFAKALYHGPLDEVRIPPNPVPALDDLPTLDDDVPFGTPSVAQNDAARIDFDSVLVRVSTVPPPVSLAAFVVPTAPAPGLRDETGELEQVVAKKAPPSDRRAATFGAALLLSGAAVGVAAYAVGPRLLPEQGPSAIASPIAAEPAAPVASAAPVVAEPEAKVGDTMVFGLDDLPTASPTAPSSTPAVGSSVAPVTGTSLAAPAAAAPTLAPEAAAPAAEAPTATETPAEAVAAPVAEAPAATEASATETPAVAEPVAPAPEPTPEQRMDALLSNAVSSTSGAAITSLAPERAASSPRGLAPQPERSEVVAAMRGVAGQVDQCTSATGSVTVRITFGSDGSVRSASAGAPFAGTSEGACMAQAVQGAHVSPFARPTFTVSYPFTLR